MQSCWSMFLRMPDVEQLQQAGRPHSTGRPPRMTAVPWLQIIVTAAFVLVMALPVIVPVAPLTAPGPPGHLAGERLAVVGGGAGRLGALTFSARHSRTSLLKPLRARR
jgi:hypothetical protein